MAKTVFALIFTLIVSASIPSTVFSAAIPRSKAVPLTLGGFYLSPTISGYLFSGSEQRDATQTYGLKVGYDKIGTSIANSLGIEGAVNYFSTASKADAGDASGYIFRLDAIFPFILGAKWMPFLAVGGGGIIIDNASHPDKSPLFDYGAGLKYFLEDYLAVRMDVRQLIVYNNINTRNNFEVGVGLSYYFGKERKKKPVPPPATKKEETKDAKNGKKTTGTATKSASGIPSLEEIATTTEGKADGEEGSALKGETAAVPASTSLVPLFALTPLLALESSAKLLFQAEAPKESVGEKYMVREVSPAKVKAAPAPAGEKTPIQVAVPVSAPVLPAPPIKVEAVPPANAETVPAAVAAEAAATTPAEEKPPIQIPTAVVAPEKTPPSAATIPSPVITEERKPETALALPMAAGSAQPSPAKTEEPVLTAAEKIVVGKLSVEFNSDSSYIKPKFHNELVELADIMKSSDSISARIEVHSDSIGDSTHNTMLSEKRAERVRNSLINLGVNPDRISTVVYEPSRPIADNAATGGGQKNPQAVTLVTLTGYAKTVPAPVTAVVAAPVKTKSAPTPAEEKKPVQVTAPGVVPAPLASPTIVETVPLVRAEAVPAPVPAEEISAPAKVAPAPLKTEPALTPAEEKKPLQVTAPGVAPAPPAIVGTVPLVRTEAVPAPVAAEEISTPAKVEAAPVKSEPAPTPSEEKKPLQVTAPGVAPAPPAIVGTVPPVRTGAVPAPVAAEEISTPAKVEAAPVKSEPAPAPAEEKKPLQVTTPAEGEMPARQAVEKKVVRMLTVEFDVNRSYIKPKYYNELIEIADIMKNSANASARIEGHADATGRFSLNIKLSKQRAQSVRSSLIKLGVAPDRITTVGFGPTRPIADNATVEGRRSNRRAVTFVTLVICE